MTVPVFNPDAVTSIAGNSLTYDNAGNLLTYNGMTNVWNYRNRLTDTSKAGTTTHYAYDQNDQRVLMDMHMGSGTTTTTYWNKYYETSGATTTLYVYAGDTLIATLEGNGIATTTNVIHTDHLGGTNVTSDAEGNLAQLNTYYPYGSIRQNENAGTLDTKRKYIGQYYDDATDLNYLNARYYQGQTGKFLSQDPIARDVGMMQKMPAYLLMVNQSAGTIDQNLLLSNPQMLNSYSYSVNNPVNISDPSGQNPYVIAGGAAFMTSVVWNLGSDIHANWQNPNIGWYNVPALVQPHDANPGLRYFSDARDATLVAVGTVAAGQALAPYAAGALTVGGAQVLTATAGGLLNAGMNIYSGKSRDASGHINGAAVAADFVGGFVGTRIGQQIPNPVGAPPSTVTGSLGGARAATEQLRAQLGQLVQALSSYVTTLKAQQSTTK